LVSIIVTNNLKIGPEPTPKCHVYIKKIFTAENSVHKESFYKK